MRVFAAALPMAALAYRTEVSSSVSANPIRRIVTLLQDMKKEIELDGEKEEALFKKFMCYCKNNDGQLSADAKVAEETIATNNAAATDKTGQKQTLDEELKQHKADRAEATKTLAQATDQRQKEKTAYDEAAGDLKKYIEGTQAALKALKRGTQSGKMPLDPNAFLQTADASALKKIVAVANLEADDMTTMLNFLQGDYHTVGNEIIGILDNMLEEFDKSLNGAVEQETKAIKLFQELKAAKESEIANATKAIESKSEIKGRLAVEIVQHKAAAETAAKELSDAQQFLLNLKQTCADKQADWDARSKARADELSAIQEAIDVLNDDDALDIFKAAVGGPKEFVQKKVSFLQTKNSVNVEARVSKILKSVKGSPALNLLASTALAKMKSTVDFSKIIIMIDDMVKLLKEEQEHDASTKTRCEDDLRNNEAQTKETNTQISSLQSKIEALEAAIAENRETVAQKTQEIADLDKSMKEAGVQRKSENDEFHELMNLNTSAVQLIEKAKNKLNKFYNPGQYKAPEERELTEEERLLKGAGQDIGDTTAKQTISGTSQTVGSQLVFLQVKSSAPELPPAPETYGEHKSKGQKSNSVIALLNLMQNDLKSEMQAAEHGEQTAQRDYETLITDATKQRAEAEKSIADTNAAIAEAEQDKNSSSESLTAEQSNLADLGAEKERLHQECDFILAHFEERREARTTEIEGLTTAKSVLSGASFQ